jgi:hypothetical protein
VEELLDAAVGAAVDEFSFEPPAAPFGDQLRAHVQAVRAVLTRHPALPQLRSRAPIVQPPAFRMSEPALRILLDAGFPPDEAARAFRLLFVYVFGSMLFGPEAPSAAEQRSMRAALLSLPEDEFPAVTASAGEMAAAVGGPEQFNYGLERIIGGLEARLRELRERD